MDRPGADEEARLSSELSILLADGPADAESTPAPPPVDAAADPIVILAAVLLQAGGPQSVPIPKPVSVP